MAEILNTEFDALFEDGYNCYVITIIEHDLYYKNGRNGIVNNRLVITIPIIFDYLQ